MGIHQYIFGKYLLITNTVSCGLLMGVGDVIQQRGEHWRQHHYHKYFPSAGCSAITTESNKNVEMNTNQEFEHNYVRTKNMTTVGIMQGPFHHYFYSMLDKILPGRNTICVIKKTFIDQTIASPVCLAIFFFGHGTLERRNLQEINDEVKLKLLDTWKVDCCFWPPTQFINFLFVPIQYRVIYINLMTMIYDIFLSYMKYTSLSIPTFQYMVTAPIMYTHRMLNSTNANVMAKLCSKIGFWHWLWCNFSATHWKEHGSNITVSTESDFKIYLQSKQIL